MFFDASKMLYRSSEKSMIEEDAEG